METRWRFLVGLALLAASAMGVVLDYRATAALLPLARTIDVGGGPMGRLIADALDAQRDYRGFVWFQWFHQNLPNIWTLFAVLLGSGGLIPAASGSGAGFALALPISRRRWLGVRAATALGELLVLAIVPSLVIPLFSPTIGQSYGLGSALVHGACLFLAGAAFFCLACFLSTIFNDIWRPLLIGCAVAMTLAVSEFATSSLSRFGIFHVMSGESYFRTGAVPWLGLLAAAGASAALLYAAAFNIAQRDF
jgi:hypothetical protein